MISVEQYKKMGIDSPYQKKREIMSSFDSQLEMLQQRRPKELMGFKEHLETVRRFQSTISEQKIELSVEMLWAKIQDDMQAEKDSYLSRLEDAYEDVDRRVEQRKNEIVLANIEHNKMCRSANKAANVTFETLEEKRKSLEKHSDKIFDTCSLYGIKLSDVCIGENAFTPDELDALYDDYLAFIEKEETGGNIITKFRNIIPDTMAQGMILLVLFILCCTKALNYLAIVFFVVLILNQVKSINKVKYYSVLLSVVFNIKPENMGFCEFDESQLLPEIITDEMLDTDPRFKEFEELYDNIESTVQNPEQAHNDFIMEWSKKKSEIDDTIKEYCDSFNNHKKALLSDITMEIEHLENLYKELKDEWKFIGERYTKSAVLNTKFVLGLHDDCMEEAVDTNNKNIIIRPSLDQNLMNKFLQCLCVNAFSNVWPGKVSIDVYDPNDFGRSLMPLYNSDLEDYLKFHKEKLDEVLKELTDYAQSNFKRMSGKTIQEFNTHAESVGITPIEYRILIILSQPSTVEEDEALNAFFDYSATGGVFIWLVSDTMQSDKAYVFRRPFEGVTNPITNMVTDDWCRDVAINYVEAINNAKPAGLPWKEFIDNVFPPEKVWKGNTDNYMDLFPGYENGDPNAYKPFEVGNTGNVHVIGVGGTGAGKSVFLNHLVATIAQQYSPREVELWMADFKGTEFKFYLPTTTSPYMLPHIKACLCTSDGDYATSLFKALRDQADLRYEILKDPNMYRDMYNKDYNLDRSLLPYTPTDEPIPNQKGTVGWNKYWRKKAEETGDEKYLDNVWPRILFICDEFQVIFEKASSDNLDRIKADITQIAKVGRAANVHIFFTSQSMNKTLSADILQQFTLRFALRCAKEVSQEILGTHNASNIKEKFGYLYVSATGIDKERQPRYKTPFIADDVLRGHIKNMAERAEAEGIPKKDVITYEEATKHPIEELEAYYKRPDVQAKLPDSGLFFLGNRMAYSTNKAPDNIIMPAQNDMNLTACFSDYTDYVMFFKQMMVNIQNNKMPGTVIINSQVDDLAYITSAEDYITDTAKHGEYLSSKTSPDKVVDLVTRIYNKRKEKNKKDTPVWIFLLGWEKAPGISIDPDMTKRKQLVNLMKTVGEFNIHFIFMNTTMVGFPSNVVESSKYTVAGKCTNDDSMSTIGTRQAGANYDMATGWLFCRADGEVTRDKLYISVVEREIQKLKFVM